MSVVPLKEYSYLDWVTIAAKVSAMRAQKGIEPWPHYAVDALWREFFGDGG